MTGTGERPRRPSAGRRFWRRQRWLLARRAVQLFTLAAFLLGPWAGLWLARGTLASSEWFATLALTDPFVALQALLARHALAAPALLGAALVAAAWALLGGRSFCGWVCPIGPVTDLAAWLRARLHLPALLARHRPDRRLRYAILAVVLTVSATLGSVAWETVNPITFLQRALVFGLVSGYGVTLAVFLFDLFILPRGWCGHVCPVGAFYGVLGRASTVYISAENRDDCTRCGDCFRVCPEAQVIAPALYGADHGRGPLITSADCIRCARCIDVCEENVFSWKTGFGSLADAWRGPSEVPPPERRPAAPGASGRPAPLDDPSGKF